MTLAERQINGVDVSYRPGTSDENVIVDVFERKYHVPPNGAPPPGTILDLGANIGLTMLHYRMLYPDAEIFGVEMDPENVTVAYRNTDDPVLCAAVTAKNRIEGYNAEGEPWAYNLDALGDRVTVGVPLGRIGRRHVDLVKMDIEGSEASVLPTADLSRFQAILVETHGDYTKPDAIRDLQAAGFETRADLPHVRAVYAWRAP